MTVSRHLAWNRASEGRKRPACPSSCQLSENYPREKRPVDMATHGASEGDLR